jgi:thiamine pyrophosphokinase
LSKSCCILLRRGGVIPQNMDLIGADRGALQLARAEKRMVLAIGDFDSVSPAEMKEIEPWADTVQRLHPVKDDADSEAAVRAALAMGYDHILLHGGLGGRVDHEVINLRLCVHFPGILVLEDEQNMIRAEGPGTYSFAIGTWPYVSFFTLDRAVISLSGFKYPLQHRELGPLDLYTVSNELISSAGTLTIHEGIVLIMESRDKNRPAEPSAGRPGGNSED